MRLLQREKTYEAEFSNDEGDAVHLEVTVPGSSTRTEAEDAAKGKVADLLGPGWVLQEISLLGLPDPEWDR